MAMMRLCLLLVGMLASGAAFRMPASIHIKRLDTKTDLTMWSNFRPVVGLRGTRRLQHPFAVKCLSDTVPLEPFEPGEAARGISRAQVHT